MSARKIMSAEGKEVEATDSVEDLSKNLCEAFDYLRAGIIDVETATALSAIGRSVIAAEMLGLLRDKMLNKQPNSKFLGMPDSKKVEQITTKE